MTHEKHPVIVYDGDCPLCSNYARMARLRLKFGDIRLIDARSNDPVVATLRRKGYDLDAGMVFIEDGIIHHGAAAMHRIAVLSDRPGPIERIMGHRTVARLAYPVLAAGRRLLLGLLGRERIASPPRRPATTRRHIHTIVLAAVIGYAAMIHPATVSFAKQYPGYGVRDEIFPFFSWSLFSYPKRHYDKFSIIPLETTEDSPIASRIGKVTNRDHTRIMQESQFRKTALTLFHGLRNQDSAAATAAQKPFDNYMRRLGVTRYRFVKVEVDVLRGTVFRSIDYGELVTGEPITTFEKPIFEIAQK